MIVEIAQVNLGKIGNGMRLTNYNELIKKNLELIQNIASRTKKISKHAEARGLLLPPQDIIQLMDAIETVVTDSSIEFQKLRIANSDVNLPF